MYSLIHPNYTLHANEVGVNTVQKSDGHIGGMKF